MKQTKLIEKTIKRWSNSIAKRFPIVRATMVEQHRNLLSTKVKNIHDSVIKYGPFQGFKLSNDAYWGAADHGTMILGIYEQEILNEITKENNKSVFVDLGAADGYYGIGVLINQHFKKSYCFEISEKGRATIRRNAELNGKLNEILILGTATSNFYDFIAPEDRNDCLILIDIEGAEFEILSDETFKNLPKAIFIIEIHEWYEDIESKLKRLIHNSSKTHQVTEILMTSRDLSAFSELKDWHDNDRWLLCSERREHLMKWLRFDPV